MSDPGTRWEYGINIDFVGQGGGSRSGKRLEAYLRDALFAPLGMSDTGFQHRPTACASGWSACMRAARTDRWRRSRSRCEQNPEFHMGGGGLYGTAADYIKFCQMILNNGRGNGNQLLKPETVAMMGQNHIGDLTMGKMSDDGADVHQRCRVSSPTSSRSGASPS